MESAFCVYFLSKMTVTFSFVRLSEVLSKRCLLRSVWNFSLLCSVLFSHALFCRFVSVTFASSGRVTRPFRFTTTERSARAPRLSVRQIERDPISHGSDEAIHLHAQTRQTLNSCRVHPGAEAKLLCKMPHFELMIVATCVVFVSKIRFTT